MPELASLEVVRGCIFDCTRLWRQCI